MEIVFGNYPDVLTVKQIAELLRIGRNSAYELVRSGEIESVTIGRQIRVLKANVISFVSKGMAAPEL